jgi:MoaA/NifB/PqqE/SkfB family radical SAM enzyme
MKRMVIELTNRCNLSCKHCFDERHAATGCLPLEIVDRVLAEGMQCNVAHLSFTGGEPNLHPDFAEIVKRVCDAAGYTFSLVTNGSTFPHLYPLFVKSRAWFKGATFSLDGAREETHDRLRGAGSFRQVMRAASICVVKDLPFTINMVVTAQNHSEIEEMIQLAARLGSRGARFGHLMPTPDTALRKLDLTPEERQSVEGRIWGLQKSSPVAIGMSPGYYSESPFFPCGPLELQEFNLDHRGNLTLCCQLSGYSGENGGEDIVGNLRDMGLPEACARFQGRVGTYLADKQESIRQGNFTTLDHFPCWYCVQYLDKTSDLRRIPGHAWTNWKGSLQGGKNNGSTAPTIAST